VHTVRRSSSTNSLPNLLEIENSTSNKGHDQNLLIHDAFATLEETFNSVPEFVGFNIELKYPLTEEIKENEIYPERNLFVDSILKVIFNCAGNRVIILSSFEPDICLLCALKQPKFPVFFLTNAGTATFRDPRCNSLEAAVKFAKTYHLLGIVSECAPFIENTDLIQQVKHEGLVLLTWGDQNNNPKYAKLQQEKGVFGIISDSVCRIKKTNKLSNGDII